jgi:hypothetical protein
MIIVKYFSAIAYLGSLIDILFHVKSREENPITAALKGTPLQLQEDDK